MIGVCIQATTGSKSQSLTFESIRNPTRLPRSLLGKSLLKQQGPQGDDGTDTPVLGEGASVFVDGELCF